MERPASRSFILYILLILSKFCVFPRLNQRSERGAYARPTVPHDASFARPTKRRDSAGSP
jgi:hypothetical protein